VSAGRGARTRAVIAAIVLCLGAPGAAPAQAPVAERNPAAVLQTEMARVQALLDAEEKGEAAAALLAISQAYPRFGAARVLLGRLALEGGDPETARTHLRVAVRTQTQRPFLAWYLLGLAELRTGRMSAAGQSFSQALVRAPHFAPALVGRAEVYRSMGDRGLAEADLRLAITLDSAPPETGLRLAELVHPEKLAGIAAAEAAGDHWGALAGYREILDAMPGAPALGAGAARVLLAMGAVEPARCLVDRALAAAPEDGALHHLACAIGVAAEEAGAAAACRRALELGREDPQLYLTLGRARFARMEVAEAIVAWTRAVELAPALGEQLPDVALSSLGAAETATFRRLLEARLAADPESGRALEGLAEIAEREGDTAAARGYLERLVAVGTDSSQAWYRLGQLRLRGGETEGGRAAMARFAELKAAEDAAWEEQNRAFRRRPEAEEAMAAGRPLDALAIYTELAAAGRATADDYLAAGHALLGLGEAAGAADWFEKILLTHPYHRAAIAGLVEAEARAGRSEEAAEHERRLDLLDWGCAAAGQRRSAS